MASNLALYNAVESSNIPAREKSELRRWFENASMLGRQQFERNITSTPSGVSILRRARSVFETGGTAAVLGYLHATIGLDFNKVPADGALAGLMNVLVLIFRDSDVSSDMQNIGDTALAVYTFRKTVQVVALRKQVQDQRPAPSNDDMAGDPNDEIHKAARAL